MYNKTYRPTREDAIGINELIKSDARIEKGQSQALYYAFKDAADECKAGKIKWAEIAKTVFPDDDKIEIDDTEYSSARSFSVEEADWDEVVKSFREQLNIEKVRISYLTRLCIIAARVRLKETEQNAINKEIVVEHFDAIKIFLEVNKKTAELIHAGKIQEIEKYLGRNNI